MKNKTAKRHIRKKPGLAPGTPIYTGNYQNIPFTWNLYSCNAEQFIEQISPKGLPTPDPNGFHFINVLGLNDAGFLDKVSKTYGIHPLALEDILNTRQRIKIDEYKESALICIKTLEYQLLPEIQWSQISIFLTNQHVICFQEDGTDFFTSLLTKLKTEQNRITGRKESYFCYLLLDYIVDMYMEVMDYIYDQIDQLEQQGGNQNPQYRNQLLTHSTTLVQLKRYLLQIREVSLRLQSGTLHIVPESAFIYFRDMNDHIANMIDMSEDQLAHLDQLYERYQSNIHLRSARVINLLTVISSIFIPLNFLAGVYGMNFTHMPGLDWEYGYHAIIAIMGLIALVMAIIFYSKQFFKIN